MTAIGQDINPELKVDTAMRNYECEMMGYFPECSSPEKVWRRGIDYYEVFECKLGGIIFASLTAPIVASVLFLAVEWLLRRFFVELWAKFDIFDYFLYATVLFALIVHWYFVRAAAIKIHENAARLYFESGYDYAIYDVCKLKDKLEEPQFSRSWDNMFQKSRFRLLLRSA